MLKHRFIPPATTAAMARPGGQPPMSTGGANYAAAAGATVDVPFGNITNANLWVDLGPSGPTADRPALNGSQAGQHYIDSDLGVVVAWNGAAWINVLTGAAA